MAARPNGSSKFTSINFNDIFDKKTTSTAKPKTRHQSSTSQSSASNKSHNGRMILLSRSPSPTPSPGPIQPPPLPSLVPDRGQPEEDLISLRPLGRTGPVNPPPSPPPTLSLLPSPRKTNKFVPPHLRPGFMGKEEKPEEAGGRPKSVGHDRGRAPRSGPAPGVGRGLAGDLPPRYVLWLVACPWLYSSEEATSGRPIKRTDQILGQSSPDKDSSA